MLGTPIAYDVPPALILFSITALEEVTVRGSQVVIMEPQPELVRPHMEEPTQLFHPPGLQASYQVLDLTILVSYMVEIAGVLSTLKPGKERH